MSTGSQTNQQQATDLAKQKPQELIITYTPLGESESISLTIARVKQFLIVPTKSGQMPTDAQVVRFMMLAKAQSLNPWTGDCWCIGYDGKNGPEFSLIVAHQALLKRAEASKEFDGMESGVMVAVGDVIKERPGDLLLNGEVLVGGWARVHRKDRSVASYDAVNLSTFNTGRSRWVIDPAGLIVKVAEASALRKAFPSTLAAMYCREEMERQRHDDEVTAAAADTRSATQRLADRVSGNLSDRSSETQPINTERTHEPEKVEARRKEEATQSRQEDAKEPERENVVPSKNDKEPTRDVTNSMADNLSRRINLATLPKDLAHLALEVGEAMKDGGLSQHEADALTSLINDKMPK